MAILEKELQQKVQGLIDEGSDLYTAGDRKSAQDRMASAWDLLPMPKETYDDSFHIAHYSTKIALAERNFELAKKWAEIHQHCDLERFDTGHREFVAGQVAYEAGDMETAKKYFLVAEKKSGGRAFREQDKKYRKVIGK
jgi:hypothetical protein